MTLYHKCLTALKPVLEALRGPGAMLVGMDYRVSVPFAPVFTQPGNRQISSLPFGTKVRISYVNGQAIPKGRVTSVCVFGYWTFPPIPGWIFMDDIRPCLQSKRRRDHA